MTEKEAVIGYYTEDGNIYCVECINKNIEIMKKIDHAIAADDLEETLYPPSQKTTPACRNSYGEKGRKIALRRAGTGLTVDAVGHSLWRRTMNAIGAPADVATGG